jgi:iron complex transport system substrate-binding protein
MLRSVALVALLAAALAFAACGDDTPTGTASRSSGSTTAVFPVTVTHKLGKVTIEREPQRVVALDYPSADAVIALGTTPVGMYEVS